MSTTLEIIDAKAHSQWSLVTRHELLDEGISVYKIARLLRSGALRRVGHRVYATVGSPRSWEQAVMARVLSAGVGAVASHAVAARLWTFSHLPEEAMDVTIESDRTMPHGGRRPGLHRTVVLPQSDVAVRSGIPCTTFERTLSDCSSRLTPFQLGRVLDDGLRRGLVSLPKLTTCVFGLDSGPGRRLHVIKQLLAERDASFVPGGSASELRVLAVLLEAGIPAPVQQYRVSVDSRTFDLDFAWPEQRVFAEFYGLQVHSGVSAVAYDSARLTTLVGADWRPLVFTDSTPDHEIIRHAKKALAIDQ